MRRHRDHRQDPILGLGTVLRLLLAEVGNDLHRIPPSPKHLPTRSEKIEQQQIKHMLEICRVAVYDTSQVLRYRCECGRVRVLKPQITPGLPDLICIDSRRSPWRLFFVEVKRRGEGQEPAQRVFEEVCRRAEIDYVLGSTTEVAQYLGLENARD